MFHSRVCSGRKHYATRSAWHWAAPERIWALLAPPRLSQVHQEYWRRRTLGSQLQKYLWEPDKDPEVFPKYLIFNVEPVKRAIVFFTLSLKHVSSGWKKSVRWAGMYYKYYYTHFFDIRRYLLGLEYLGEKKGHSDGEVNNRVTTWISAYIEKGVK